MCFCGHHLTNCHSAKSWGALPGQPIEKNNNTLLSMKGCFILTPRAWLRSSLDDIRRASQCFQLNKMIIILCRGEFLTNCGFFQKQKIPFLCLRRSFENVWMQPLRPFDTKDYFCFRHLVYFMAKNLLVDAPWNIFWATPFQFLKLLKLAFRHKCSQKWSNNSCPSFKIPNPLTN